MKKQNQEQSNYLQDYLIPHMKNKFERNLFNQRIHQWVCKKFEGARQTKYEKEVDISVKQQIQSRKQKIRQIQNLVRFKYSVEKLILRLPIQYYETLIQYVMQKKLFWIFKLQNESEDESRVNHKKLQVSLALGLKKYYKNFQFGDSLLPQENEINKKTEKSSNKYNSTKKSSFDFQYDLMVMYSISIAALFFQESFAELSIEKDFKSQIYIIINHAFLDMYVSPNVYEIMRKKYIVIKNEKNFESINACYIHEKSISQQKNKQFKHGSSPESKKTILDEKIKLSFAQSSKTLHTIQSDQCRQYSTRQILSKKVNPISIHRLNSSVGFLHSGSNKIVSKKGILLKPTSSLDHCLSSERQFRLQAKPSSLNKSKHSRFNSFIKDARQLNIPTIIEQTLGEGYLPTVEEIQFYSTIKKCLHVDSLPPLIKKKMNVNQYEKLNELQQLKDIRKEVKSLDVSSKKNHMKSNELSLAMNTLISQSCAIPNKKRNKKSLQVVENCLQNQIQQDQNAQNQDSNAVFDNQKQNFQFRKLPLKAAHLKLQYQKCSGIYQFCNQLQNAKSNSKEVQVPIVSHSLLSSRKLYNSENKVDNSFNKQFQASFYDKKKITSTEWQNFIKVMKTNQSKENIMSFNQNQRKTEKKRILEKQPHFRRQIDSYTNLMTSKPLLKSFKSINLNDTFNQSVNKNSPNLLTVSNSRGHRQSILEELSSNLEPYELRAKGTSQVEVMNQITHRNQQTSKYSSLQGQVNVQNQSSMNYKGQYKSFELKKKLRNFETNCKIRDQKAHHTMFKIKNHKSMAQINGEVGNFKDYKKDEDSYNRISEI